MTNEQLATNFLSRFGPPKERDVAEMAAMLRAAEEEGMAKVEWAFHEPTAVTTGQATP